MLVSTSSFLYISLTLHTISSAVIGSPSDQTRPLRRWSVMVFWSSEISQRSARPGSHSRVSWLRRTTPANMRSVMSVVDVSLATTGLKVLASEMLVTTNRPPWLPRSHAE